MITKLDEMYMGKAIRLASLSLGMTSPNPGVGCVIVKDGIVIGKGRHERYGSHHAEIMAIKDVDSKSENLFGSTVFVTLAPCTKEGRTPACLPELIKRGVERIVVAISDESQDDPSSLCAKNNIIYEEGCCEKEARLLHGGFLKRIEFNRPRFTGKWAMTVDGFIATDSYSSNWISSKLALKLSRRRRRIYDGILIGANTAQKDNPSLLSLDKNRTPLRIILSSKPVLPDNLLQTAKEYPVLLIYSDNDEEKIKYYNSKAVKTVQIKNTRDMLEVATCLYNQGLNDVLVEGGSKIHNAFMNADLYDRLEIYIGSKTIASGLPTSFGKGIDLMENAKEWKLEIPPKILDDCILLRYCD